MDLIYTNSNGKDLGVVQNFTLDLAFGKDENNFELTVAKEQYNLQAGYFIYCDNSDYGGVIDSIQVDSESESLVYKGRTFQGILASKYITPKTFKGSINSLVQEVLEEIGLAESFTFTPLKEDCHIEEYKLEEYTDAYQTLLILLEKVNCKMQLQFIDGTIQLKLLPIIDYSELDHWDSSLLNCTIEKVYNNVNHLIVYNADTEKKLDLYIDANAEISAEQMYFGMEERIAVLISSATIEEEMQKEGEEELKRLQDTDNISVNLSGDDETCYDILDKVGLIEQRTGIEIKQKITKKIVTMTDDNLQIEYQTGEIEE